MCGSKEHPSACIGVSIGLGLGPRSSLPQDLSNLERIEDFSVLATMSLNINILHILLHNLLHNDNTRTRASFETK
jgi:hypothetical protein